MSIWVNQAILTFAPATLHRAVLHTSPLTVVLFVVLLLQYFLLGYGVISRLCMDYLIMSRDTDGLQSPPVRPRKTTEKVSETIPRKLPHRRVVRVENNATRKRTDEATTKTTIRLTRKRFNNYMDNECPYLDPQLKITDLVTPLQANRTILSNFINQTYGMNFNRYINRLRLLELERLSLLPLNAGKEFAQLLPKAGFNSMRNYTRALQSSMKADATAEEMK